MALLMCFFVLLLSFSEMDAQKYKLVAGSMASTTRARTYSEATLLAQSLVDMVGTDIELVEGSVGGEAPGGYSWSLDISTYEPQFENDRSLELAEVSGTLLYWVDVEVGWGQERRARQVRFSTVRSILASRQR